MRFIVALALAALLNGQSPIANVEARIAKDPDNLALRGSALRLYTGVPGQAIDTAAREGRRRHILWLIEHHPDAPDLATYWGVIDPDGFKADAEGYATAGRLWREIAANPDASAKALANAAWFFKISDRAESRLVMDRAWSLDPEDRQVSRVRGMLDVIIWLGATRLERNDVIAACDPALSDPNAFAEIESSRNASLIGNAAQFLMQQFSPAVQAALGDRDPLDLAERWIRKARELEPGNNDWNTALSLVYQREAAAALDPHWKAQLLRKALDLASGPQRLRVGGDLADAEFSAGDDESAERDAIPLFESNDPYAIYVGHTLLGRIALARGDLMRAKQHLLDSAHTTMPSFVPRMTLAQDLLDRGERDTVLQYLELCRSFWKNDRGFIDHFEPILKNGGKPDLLAFYNPNPPPVPKLPAPEVLAGPEPSWKPVVGAESYVVEWDVRKNGRWSSDTDGAFRVVPTDRTSAKIDIADRPIRWRVFAVGRQGRGAVSQWQMIDNLQ